MKNFNPGAGDARRVGVPDNGLREREPQHTRGALLWIGIFGSASPQRHADVVPSRLCVCRAASQP